jgi:hypothetical protein
MAKSKEEKFTYSLINQYRSFAIKNGTPVSTVSVPEFSLIHQNYLRVISRRFYGNVVLSTLRKGRMRDG